MKLLLLSMCALWCWAAPPEKAKPSQARPAGLNDSAIEKEIKRRFARSKIAANNFQVKVQGGVATLDGTANIIQHKGIATRIPRNAGAREVVNRIRVSEAAKQKALDQMARSGGAAGTRRATVKRQQ